MKQKKQPLQEAYAAHNCRQVAAMVEGVTLELSQTHASPVRGAVVDSRELEPDLLFVARRGAERDGHDYIAAAWQQGCRNFMVALDWWRDCGKATYTNNTKHSDANFLVVDETLWDGGTEAALFAWARAYRQSLKQLVLVAISGSYGKTSCKELLARMLAQRYRCSATAGNRNALAGCAMTILGIPQNAEVAVLELGIDHPGEMDLLCSMAQPNISLITGIGTAHMQAFRSQAELAQEKAQIYQNLSVAASGPRLAGLERPLAFLPTCDPQLQILQEAVPQGCEMRLYTPELPEIEDKEDCENGLANRVDNYVEDLGLQGLRIHYGAESFALPLLGLHMQRAFWAASAVAEALNVSSAEIVAGAQDYRPLFGRGELQHCQLEDLKLTLLQDCYNASPESVYALLQMLGSWQKNGVLPPSVLVLADMLELGASSADSHRRAAKLLLDELILPQLNRQASGASAPPLSVLFYGEEMKTAWLMLDELLKNYAPLENYAQRDEFLLHYAYCSDGDALAAAMAQELRSIAPTTLPLSETSQASEPLLVLKGARGMYLEKIAEKILR